jgi:hypothetical protein
MDEMEKQDVASNSTLPVEDKADAYNFQKYGICPKPRESEDSAFDYTCMPPPMTPKGPTIEPIFEPECVLAVKAAIQKCRFGISMPISEFRVWFDAIRSNDTETISTILEELGEDERHRILNAPFAYNVQSWKSSDVELGNLFFLPTILAAAFQAVDALELLHEKGASIYSRDVGGHNIIHALCQLSSFIPSQEANYVQIYELILKLTKDPVAWKRLLVTENEAGLRPLELAAKFGTFTLFERILNTEGVYKTYLGNFGLFHTAFYDMTEYEFYGKVNRRLQCPLRFFLYLQRNDLKRDDCKKLMNSEVMQKWMSKRIVETRPFLIVWFIFRLVLVALFFISSGHERLQYIMEADLADACGGADKDKTSELPLKQTVYQTMLTICILATGCVITFDILDLTINYICKRAKQQLYKRPGETSPYVVQWVLYRTLHTIMLVCMFSYVIIVYLHVYHGLETKELRTYMGVIHTVICFLVTWSFLYFAQFLPFMSYFVLALQRLLPTICTCGLLFFVVYASFSTAVYYLEGYPCEARSLQYLTGFFTSLSNSATINKAWEQEEGTVILLYILFAFISFIFMLAFIILVIIFAIKLSFCSDVDIIRQLQCLDASVTIDHRIGWLFYAPCRQSKTSQHGIFYINEATKEDTDNNIVTENANEQKRWQNVNV